MQPETQQPQPQNQPVNQPPQVSAAQPAVPSQNMQPTAVEQSPQPPEPQQKKEGGGILSFIGTLFAAFILVQFINIFLFQSYKVFGSSMYPTLHDGDRLIISKIGKSTSSLLGKTYEPKRGDVVVFNDPLGSDIQLIKRVIGLPGERVVLKNGVLTVYNKENPKGFNPDDADYGEMLPKGGGNKDITVPEGELFVSGDNRKGNNSLDSRNELGTVPEDMLVGTLVVRLFPFDRAGFF